ncbi:hypothetical protein [Streptomyces sp. NPDC056264]|uniref:hypothetical protein n=1 Tax=Streptomyces sp. NPDC056264 TaxID=3345767 RepID=UPI003AB03366
MAYTGALSQQAHFPRYISVPGVSGGHVQPTEDPDPFEPAQPNVQQTTVDAWLPQEPSFHTDMQVKPRTHWADLQQPVPSNIEGPDEDLAATARMLANHSVVDFRPDQYIPYRHATEGRTIEYTEGRRPVEPSMEALLAGQNSYDFTNHPSEVYGGERYRLGTRIEDFGHYEFWTQQGQDAWLRAYSGLEPAFPVDKPRVENSAPYTPNSSGTTTWLLSPFQDPSSFALPSETSISDFALGNGSGAVNQDFDEGTFQ